MELRSRKHTYTLYTGFKVITPPFLVRCYRITDLLQSVEIYQKETHYVAIDLQQPFLAPGEVEKLAKQIINNVSQREKFASQFFK